MNKLVSKEEIFSNKYLREGLEIDMFLNEYNKKYNTDFTILEKREKPDYFVKDSNGKVLGVELSSVYMDDRVVFEHKKEELIEISYNPENHQEVRNRYFTRIIEKIEAKANKIKNDKYDSTYPIILSLYLNDYYCIHIKDSEWKYFFEVNDEHLSEISGFKEIFFIR